MIITINKLGELTEHTKNTTELYKLCNYRNNTNFELLCSWNDEYELYGKKVGRSGNENMYEFPPPIDKELYFGTLCIVKKNDTNELFNIKEWKIFYNVQYGGFENLTTDDNSIDQVSSDEEYTNEKNNKNSSFVESKELLVEEYINE